MTKKLLFSLLFVSLTLSVTAQVGIRGGMNVASQRINKNYTNSDMTRFQAGVTYSYLPRKGKGFGLETGLLYTQKGSIDKNHLTNKYKLNYIEIPLNLRYLLQLGPIGIYAHAGLYGGYLTNMKHQTEAGKKEIELGSFSDRLDFGYNAGAGIELLRKIQLGFNWSAGFKNLSYLYESIDPSITTCKNRLFSVTLAYLF